METKSTRFGILVGGGPAPGINGVISAATIEARKHGHEVVGFYDGFEHLSQGRSDQCRKLDIPDVTRIHFQGGSILRTSRANPTKDPAHMANVLKALKEHQIEYLVTIGGDDTGYSASKVSEAAAGAIKVAHVPKTIDNDLPLPPGTPTFGFETARHVGTEIVRNLIADATTTPRWYVVVAMGRTAGHLALGIGKSSAAQLSIIPEEFPAKKKVTFKDLCDIVEGSILKRRSMNRNYGVAILAEGLVERMEEDEIVRTFGADNIQRDAHGHIRLDDLDLGTKCRDELRRRFKQRGVSITVVAKNLGYELRSADPIPFDREYTRDLGFGAVRALLSGANGVLISFVGGRMIPEKFHEMPRLPNGRLIPRLVDVAHESYQVAREYMIRLDARDREPARLAKLAAEAKMSEAAFLDWFGHLMA